MPATVVYSGVHLVKPYEINSSSQITTWQINFRVVTQHTMSNDHFCSPHRVAWFLVFSSLLVILVGVVCVELRCTYLLDKCSWIGQINLAYQDREVNKSLGWGSCIIPRETSYYMMLNKWCPAGGWTKGGVLLDNVEEVVSCRAMKQRWCQRC